MHTHAPVPSAVTSHACTTTASILSALIGRYESTPRMIASASTPCALDRHVAILINAQIALSVQHSLSSLRAPGACTHAMRRLAASPAYASNWGPAETAHTPAER